MSQSRKKQARDADWMLRAVAHERQASIGLGDGDGALSAQREQALKYYRGDMSDMKPALPNRSQATDSTVADTVETALPDLMEIFASEDVLAFDPVDEADMEQAEAEADYLRHALFAENNGWLVLHNATKDALLCKIGVFKAWWAEKEHARTVGPMPLQAATLAREKAEAQGLEVELVEHDDDERSGQASVRIVQRKGYAKVCAVPPEDFGFSADGATIEDCTYFVVRSERRAQDLIEEGFDPELIAKIDEQLDDEEDNARDTVEEMQDDVSAGSDPDLRTVTIHEHFIRTDYDGTGVKRWRVVTDSTESLTLAEPEDASGYAFAVMTPFIQPHRLIGLSLADKTIEVQRITTALLRQMLDSGYFALNQRVEISDEHSNDDTIADWMNNQPGMPVRVARTGAVKPISAGGLGFDVAGALEYVATMAEKRSGIIRNAQGLNPDSLHDTAAGQNRMLDMSQKRIRYIGRAMCSTGLRDLFLGMHRLYREHATKPVSYRKGGGFASTDPAQWLERDAVRIEVGSYSRQEAIASMMQLKAMIAEIIELQGGPNGPLIDYDGIYRAAQRIAKLLPVEGIEDIFQSPEGYEPPPAQEDPAVAIKRQELELKAQEAEHKRKLEADKADADAGLAQQRADFEADLARAKADADAGLAQDRAAVEAQLARERTAFEQQMAMERFAFEQQMAREKAEAEREFRRQAANDAAQERTLPATRPGGRLDE